MIEREYFLNVLENTLSNFILSYEITVDYASVGYQEGKNLVLNNMDISLFYVDIHTRADYQCLTIELRHLTMLGCRYVVLTVSCYVYLTVLVFYNHIRGFGKNTLKNGRKVIYNNDNKYMH